MIPEREDAVKLLKEFNEGDFHIQHALTVERVMRWYANYFGFSSDADFWATVGLLHDLDFEKYPEHHCIKTEEIMRERGIDEKLIHAVVSHGYGITVDVAPEHKMEKTLFAVDELTGLIGAVVLMLPSKNIADMQLKTLKKKFKDKKFAAGCSREVIEKGAEMLEMPIDELLETTLRAMQETA
ncbi:MAG: hydrolase [Clostridia bacterium]|nr:hydrolase [Clostridia bacterium]